MSSSPSAVTFSCTVRDERNSRHLLNNRQQEIHRIPRKRSIAREAAIRQLAFHWLDTEWRNLGGAQSPVPHPPFPPQHCGGPPGGFPAWCGGQLTSHWSQGFMAAPVQGSGGTRGPRDLAASERETGGTLELRRRLLAPTAGPAAVAACAVEGRLRGRAARTPGVQGARVMWHGRGAEWGGGVDTRAGPQGGLTGPWTGQLWPHAS